MSELIRLIKEALRFYIIKTRIDAFNQGCYAAIAYGNEQKLKRPDMPDEELDAAIKLYLVLTLPGTDNVDMHLDSIRARMLGAGTNPDQKL